MSRSLLRIGLSLFSVAAVFTAHSAFASGIDLGAAAGFSVLTFNTNNTSDTEILGGPIGVVNGNWVQSGGGATNAQQTDPNGAKTVILSPGFTNNGPSFLTTVTNGPLLQTAWSAAQTASSNFSSMAATPGSITSVSGNTTVTETVAGNYVLDISSFADNSNLKLVAPTGSTFVVNITSGALIHLNSNTWSLGPGLTSNDVVYNFLNGTSLQTAGGGNSTVIDGIVLDTTGSINLHPGQINGEVIAQTFTSSSGAEVNTPNIPSVPETSSFLPLLLFLGCIVLTPVIRRKYYAATAA